MWWCVMGARELIEEDSFPKTTPLALELGKVLNKTKQKKGNPYRYLVISSVGCWKDEPQLMSEALVFYLWKLSSCPRTLSSLHVSLTPQTNPCARLSELLGFSTKLASVLTELWADYGIHVRIGSRQRVHSTVDQRTWLACLPNMAQVRFLETKGWPRSGRTVGYE